MQDSVDVTIPNGATTSAAVDVGPDWYIVGIVTDADFDGTTLTFQASQTLGGTYLPVIGDDGSAYTVTLAASKWVLPDPAKLFGLRFVKLVAGTTQTNDTTVALVREPI